MKHPTRHGRVGRLGGLPLLEDGRDRLGGGDVEVRPHPPVSSTASKRARSSDADLAETYRPHMPFTLTCGCAEDQAAPNLELIGALVDVAGVIGVGSARRSWRRACRNW